MIGVPATMDRIPRMILVLVLPLEIGLLGSSKQGNLLKIDCEWVLSGLEGARGEIDLRNNVFLLLLTLSSFGRFLLLFLWRLLGR